MLFIVFDIEIVFLYPLAVQLHALGWFGFAELAFFVLILLVAYVYIWRKGALSGDAQWLTTRDAPARLRAPVGAAALADEGAVAVRGGDGRRRSSSARSG